MDLTGWPYAHLMAITYALPRMLVVFTVVPLMVRESLPMLIRISVVGSFAVFLVPGLLAQASTIPPSPLMVAVLAKEALVGLALALVIGLPLWVLEGMGDVADTQRGASIAQALNPLTGHETSPLGQLFSQAAVTLVLVMGGLTMMLGVLYRSFEIWPVFAWWPAFTPQTPAIFLALVDRLMLLVMLLAAPVVFVMFVAEVGLAIISRFTPQLQVFFLAMPIKSALAMFVFAVYAVVLFDHTAVIVQETWSTALERLVPAFGGARP